MPTVYPFMIFRPMGKNERCAIIHIMRSSILDFGNAKFLGVITDNKLNWLEHMKCIPRPSAKCTGIIIKACKLFDTELSLNLYNAWHFPIFHTVSTFGVPWHVFTYKDFMHCTSYNLWCSSLNAHRTPFNRVLKSLACFNVDQIRDYSTVIYQMTKCMLPSMLKICLSLHLMCMIIPRDKLTCDMFNILPLTEHKGP